MTIGAATTRTTSTASPLQIRQTRPSPSRSRQQASRPAFARKAKPWAARCKERAASLIPILLPPQPLSGLTPIEPVTTDAPSLPDILQPSIRQALTLQERAAKVCHTAYHTAYQHMGRFLGQMHMQRVQ